MEAPPFRPLDDIVEIGIEDGIADKSDAFENIVAIRGAQQPVDHLITAVEMRHLVTCHQRRRPFRIERSGQNKGPRRRDRRQDAR